MPTTIQVKETTRKMLDDLKKEKGLRSYDEVISGLIMPKTGVPASLFGACNGSRTFVREEGEEHEFQLRD
ncbi:MAG: hypothetical protein LYZ66_00185 [Nitrososphaerales archaeon]|nr:hypothetical protein [Nitrososphaerales archaeon]